MAASEVPPEWLFTGSAPLITDSLCDRDRYFLCFRFPSCEKTRSKESCGEEKLNKIPKALVLDEFLSGFYGNNPELKLKKHTYNYIKQVKYLSTH